MTDKQLIEAGIKLTQRTEDLWWAWGDWALAHEAIGLDEHNTGAHERLRRNLDAVLQQTGAMWPTFGTVRAYRSLSAAWSDENRFSSVGIKIHLLLRSLPDRAQVIRQVPPGGWSEAKAKQIVVERKLQGKLDALRAEHSAEVTRLEAKLEQLQGASHRLLDKATSEAKKEADEAFHDVIKELEALAPIGLTVADVIDKVPDIKKIWESRTHYAWVEMYRAAVKFRSRLAEQGLEPLTEQEAADAERQLDTMQLALAAMQEAVNITKFKASR